MKKNYLVSYITLVMWALISNQAVFAQQDRIGQLQLKLESIMVDVPGLNKTIDVNVSNASLPGFLQAIAHANAINLNINQELEEFYITNNFSNATVVDVLLFSCKEYGLDIDFTGNILSIYKHYEISQIIPHREIPMDYDATTDLLSIDLQNDTLHVAIKQIVTKTNKNIVYAPGLENLIISSFIQNSTFDSAMDKLAFANDLRITKTRDNFYLIEKEEQIVIQQNNEQIKRQPQPKRRRRSNFYFHVQDTVRNVLDVDFENTPISNIVYDIGMELNINMFTSSPLDQAGTATVKANNISFDLLLNKIFENTEYTFKKERGIYYLGSKQQISLRKSVFVPLQHRSIEVMNTSSNSNGARMRNRSNVNYRSTSFQNLGSNSYNNQRNNQNSRPGNMDASLSTDVSSKNADALLNIIPEDIIKDLDVKIDIELNSFIVSGPSQNIERFKDFIAYIDKPVPVILIEVMVIEIDKKANIETGINMGIGEAPTPTKGQVFPSLDMNIGASTINKVIGGFNGFGSFNLGQVVPNFYLQLKAMESNGNIKIRSSPKLSTLNGHRANLSIGETSYYAVTERNIYGSQNPQTSEITNYLPIDAEFALNIKPLVSGDGQITLDINVTQSTFNGQKIADDAPPGMNSREFNSIIRVKDEDLVILGGLERQVKNDSGQGVPVISRVPVLKWFFSSRKREDSKNKLTILIKPTVIQ